MSGVLYPCGSLAARFFCLLRQVLGACRCIIQSFSSSSPLWQSRPLHVPPVQTCRNNARALAVWEPAGALAASLWGSDTPLELRPLTDLLSQSFALKNLKYCAAVGDEGALRMRQCPSRVHKVCLRFSNLALTENLSPNLLAESCGAASEKTRCQFREIGV